MSKEIIIGFLRTPQRIKMWFLLFNVRQFRLVQVYLLFCFTFLIYGFITFQNLKSSVNNSFSSHVISTGNAVTSVSSKKSEMIGSPSATGVVVSTDNFPASSKENIVSISQRQIPNIPLEVWWENKENIEKNKDQHTCSTFPCPLDLKFNNNYWQVFQSSNGTFCLYGAYYDNRVNVPQPKIRLLGMIDRIEPMVKTHCLLWYDAAKDPIVMPVVKYEYVWNKKWGNYKQGILQPYLISCNLPQPVDLAAKGFQISQVPISVSLTEKGCESPTNNLLVNNNIPAKKEQFAVCVKGLDFQQEDLSVRLIEWIELLGLLGVHKIFLYELEVHPKISKVLRHYQESGKVELTPISLPGEQPNVPGLRSMYLKSRVGNKRLNEVIPYNDCLYRNLYSYDYIALMDTDEIILPKTVQTWSELMDIIIPKSLAIAKYPRDSYNFRNVYFWDDEKHSQDFEPNIPTHMHMFQHVYRSRNYTNRKEYVKSFHRVDRILTIHNHFPLACLLSFVCGKYEVEPETAHLQHYRSDCVSTLKEKCNTEYKQNLVRDTTIWRYKQDLVPRVTKVLKILGYFD